MANNNVSVAVRIRPQSQKETANKSNICTRVTPGEPQISLGDDKTFTFDHVFDFGTNQHKVYDNCVHSLVEGCFDGYNATVLAYGQTGSGKTYTMGTGFDVSYSEEQLGIIPRAVRHLFDGINKRKVQARLNGLPLPEFSVTAQFIEIHNEELKDLLCKRSRNPTVIRIQVDQKGSIVLNGAENKIVSSVEDTIACLKKGSQFRSTGATLMNSESSRSHAIFTLFIKQTRVDRTEVNGCKASRPEQELVTLTAKFNFVDLAGSERLARTGAVGERAREAISINSGLLHLGNVISALGDRSKKASHIPYRDSKLTRALQDSLGGNSVTTMIACISPCDRDSVETLNTLQYANRATNIENKVVANQDSQTHLITELPVKDDGVLELNDVYLENDMLKRDLNNANYRIEELFARLEEVTSENISLKEKGYLKERGYLKEINDLRSKLVELEAIISCYQSQRENESIEVNIIAKGKQEIEKSEVVEEHSDEESEDFDDSAERRTTPAVDNQRQKSGSKSKIYSLKVIHIDCSEASCQLTFSSARKMWAHLFSFHKVHPFKCRAQGCGQQFFKFKDFGIHSSAHTESATTWLCPQCPDKSFASGQLISNHICNCHQTGKFKCNINQCQFFASTRQKIYNHQHKAHSAKLHSCPFKGCTKVFKCKSDVIPHYRGHISSSPFHCTVADCGYKSNYRSSVVQHIRVVHFKLPNTRKKQQRLGIIDHRNPSDFIWIDKEALRLDLL